MASSVAIHGGGGAPGADGGQHCVGGGGGGVEAIVGVGVNRGGGGVSTSKNHPSHHKYKSLKQFELKQS